MPFILLIGSSPAQYQHISVLECRTNAPLLLYADVEKRLPMPNPFVTNKDGSYKVFVAVPEKGCVSYRTAPPGPTVIDLSPDTRLLKQQ